MKNKKNDKPIGFTPEELEYGLVVFHDVLHMAICHNAEEALNAANSFHCGTFTEKEKEIIEKLFKGEFVEGQKNYGYTFYRGSGGHVTICPALGATIKEHQEEYHRRHEYESVSLHRL